MKKRRLLFFTLLILFSLSTAFAVVASANTSSTDYEYTYLDSKNIENYNPDEVKESLTGGLLRWEIHPLSTLPRNDGPFYMSPGAWVHRNKKNLLSFVIFCEGSQIEAWEDTSNRFRYEFSLLRQGLSDDKYYESVTYAVEEDKIRKKISVANVREMKQYESARFEPILTFVDENGNPNNFRWRKIDDSLASDYDWVEGDYYLRLFFEVPSPYVQYKAFFRMQENPLKVKKMKKNAFLGFIGGETVYNLYYDTETLCEYQIISDARSYYNVINNMNEADALETELGANPEILTYAQNVLKGEERQVKVSYLENISDSTPFAKKVEKTVSVRMWDGATELNSLDVALALGKQSVNALISPCEKFTLNAQTNVFESYYYPGVYLEAKTTDGATMQYILNPNVSYADFYGQFVDDGIITQDLYEFLFADRILNRYPDMQGLTPENVYGYFGYVLIPETFTFNQAFAELFNTQLKFDGVIKAFDYEHSISLSSYDKLLKDYDYMWLSRIWNDVWGALTECNAKHLVIFADCTTSDAYANMNGAEEIGDTNGLYVNSVESTFVSVIEKVEDLFDFNSLKKGNGLGSILVLGVVVVAVIAVYLNRKKIFR